MRSLSNTYRLKSTDALRLLRSRKILDIQKLEHAHMTYFSKRDINQARFNLKQIDAELACRAAQEQLF